MKNLYSSAMGLSEVLLTSQYNTDTFKIKFFKQVSQIQNYQLNSKTQLNNTQVEDK